jgi:ankyrin repeat protein
MTENETQPTREKPRVLFILLICILLVMSVPAFRNVRDGVLDGAVRDGNATSVKAMLQMGADPNKMLLDAVLENQPDVVKALLDKGADPNKIIPDGGGTALTAAMIYRKMDVIPVLLDHGASVDTEFPGGRNAFVWAVLAGEMGMAEQLLNKGADPNSPFGAGNTALILCARASLPDFAEVLLKYHAAVDHRNDSGETPLIAAAEAGKTDMIDVLVKNGANINAQKQLDVNYSASFLEFGRFSMTGSMPVGQMPGSAPPPKPEFVAWRGMTALMWAARKGDAQTLLYLIAKGADITIKDAKGRTAMTMARIGKHQDCIDILTKAGA